MSSLSISSRGLGPTTVNTASVLTPSAGEAAGAMAAQAAQVITASLRVPDSNRSTASVAGLTESLERAQQLMEYTSPPVSKAAVPGSSESAKAGDRQPHFSQGQQAAEQQTTSGFIKESSRVEANRTNAAHEAYRSVQKMDDGHQAAVARARNMGLFVSVFA